MIKFKSNQSRGQTVVEINAGIRLYVNAAE